MIPAGGALPKEKRDLLSIYSSLSDAGKENLRLYAEFLVQRESAGDQPEQQPVSAVPVEIPRPEKESVVSAIKRLSSSYHMLDRSVILTETSSLMTSHIMHGREADEVIDELEALFQKAHLDQFDES